MTSLAAKVSWKSTSFILVNPLAARRDLMLDFVNPPAAYRFLPTDKVARVQVLLSLSALIFVAVTSLHEGFLIPQCNS